MACSLQQGGVWLLDPGFIFCAHVITVCENGSRVMRNTPHLVDSKKIYVGCPAQFYCMLELLFSYNKAVSSAGSSDKYWWNG